MIKKLALIYLLLAFGCNQSIPPLLDDNIAVMLEDTIEHTIISQDSILKIADAAMKHLEIKEQVRKGMIKQIEKQMEDDKLSKYQIGILQQRSDDYLEQSNLFKEQNEIYQHQVAEYNKRTLVKKDSVVYNIVYRDTVIHKPVYVTDTVIVEVLDTIIVKKIKRNKNRTRKKKN